MKERFASALFGAVWGAVIGGILAWLLGAYSNTLGSAMMSVDAKSWIAGTALLFATLGLIFNVGIGTIVGSVLNAIFRFESDDEQSIVPNWLATALLFIVVGCVIWVLLGRHP